MKIVKSLLLGSAAGLVAVTAGQAADLPVKAKPVEYVKICSLYGAGFYYMPGTDLCIKVGGWVRAEMATGAISGSVTWGPFNGNLLNRTTSNFAYRARGYITADVRNQTEYGTARGYIAVGVNTNDVGLNNAANTFSSNRAFVQWAGMTAGLSQSFFDFYSVPAAQYRGGYLPASDTGDPGWMVWAYTAQFGGGFSATISAEARRVAQICNANAIGAGSCTVAPGGFASTTAGGAGAFAPVPGAYGGAQAPDVVGNLRLDQAWGGAQIMGVLHEVNPVYYGGGAAIASGHPSDQFGWAAGAGLKINFPSIAPGDYFQGQVNVTQGALRYLYFTPNTDWGMVNGNREAFGVLTDCVYGGAVAGGNASGCELTSAWGFNASFEHYWTPSWHQSLYGAYYSTHYDNTANAMLCSTEAFGAGTGTTAVAAAGCNNNWSDWGIGSRLQWDVTKTFYLGVEVLYSEMRGANTGSATNAIGPVLSVGGATLQESSASSWMVSVRAHRDFLP